MSGRAARPVTHHSLAFIALTAFVTSFALSRAFTTLFPSTVVVTGGVHFHHFWCGLAMIVVSGWLGIAQEGTYRRVYTFVFGFGGGLVGDEAGLLLTLGNYYSDLTYFVVVSIVALSLALILLFARGAQIEDEVFSVGGWERLVYVGLLITGASFLPISAGFFVPGVVALVIGVAVTAAAWWSDRQKQARKLIPGGFATLKIWALFRPFAARLAIMFICAPLASGEFAHSLAAPALSFGQSPVGDMHGLQMRVQQMEL